MDNNLKTHQQTWHTTTLKNAVSILQSDLDSGLTPVEASNRLGEYGANQLLEEEKEPFWKEFIEELREPLILLLVFTGILYIILGEISNGITIFAVILLLNTIEVVNEQRAKKAISALQKMAEPAALVIRDGETNEIQAKEVVPGDLTVLQPGRRVPADARLVECYGLAVDESSLTGESVPVDKDAAALENESAPLAERSNMIYSGTLVTRGRGKAIVVGTGMKTELGRVAGMARGIKEPRTPLQIAMDEVSKTLLWIALAFSIIIPILGILVAKQPLETMILTGLSLAFATIPEEMPIIITMVLALGAYRLSKRNAIVKHLKAVETLGAITIIATDKTGTLTENRMEVSELFPDFNQEIVLITGSLCNDTLLGGVQSTGDPLEIALVQAAQKSGLDEKELEKTYPRITEFSFDNSRKCMSVVSKDGDAYHVWVKGAPESILSKSTHLLAESGVKPMDDQLNGEMLEQAGQMAGQGLRLIAFAEKRMSKIPINQAETESQLTFLGLAGLHDPVREEVREAINVMQSAGIRTLMITGDHPLTASVIAQKIGLNGNGRIITGAELDALDEDELKRVIKDVSIFARTTPENKLRIVKVLQALGERVAVTGDGVNDAPALAMADIGVAMGETGSDVAREAGDVVLADDNYTTIANAIREGRVLFANLTKGVRYYLAIKVALVTVMMLPVLLQIQVPFAPIQIIVMELFMDLAAAAAFVSEPAEGDLMKIPPRDPKVPFMDKAMIGSILGNATGLSVAVSAAYLLTLYRGADLVVAQTVAFAAWMLGHVLLAFNMRSERQPLFQIGFFSNRLMLVWGLAALVFILLGTSIISLQSVLKITTLNSGDWILILTVILIGTFWLEVYKLFAFNRKLEE